MSNNSGEQSFVASERPVWLVTHSYGICRQLDIDWSTRRVVVALSGEQRFLDFDEIVGPFTDNATEQTRDWPGVEDGVGCYPDELLHGLFFQLERMGCNPQNSSESEEDVTYRSMVQILTAWNVKPIALGGLYTDEE